MSKLRIRAITHEPELTPAQQEVADYFVQEYRKARKSLFVSELPVHVKNPLHRCQILEDLGILKRVGRDPEKGQLFALVRPPADPTPNGI